MTIRIGCGAGFLGDNLDAPRLLCEAGGLDYLTLEYLAELTLSILAAQRVRDPRAGFAQDFIEVLGSLVPVLKAQPRLRIITNAGGVNPLACAQQAAESLARGGLGDAPIAVVAGDDLLPRLAELQGRGVRFENLDTGQTLSELRSPLPLGEGRVRAPDTSNKVTSANAYLGARPIVEALATGARIVITGRVADASLTVAPAVHEFGWAWDDWNRLAGASVAGHLIECGAQVTGGYFQDWQNLDLANVGYPIAEISADASCLITKPDGTGGVVSRDTVVEQLVYEIGDPAHYLTPDVDVDFTTVEVEELGRHRVAVCGATGRPGPPNYKVSLSYEAGFTASAQLLIYGRDCLPKARACGEIILDRVARAGFVLDRTHIECLGTGAAAGVPAHPSLEQREVMLRIAVSDHRYEAVQRFTKEVAPLVTSGPSGVAGYAVGRSPVRPVLAYWPTLVPRQLVEPKVEVRTAEEWTRKSA